MQAPTFATDHRGHMPTRSDCRIASPQGNTTSQRCNTTRQRCNTTFRPCNTTSLPCCIACLACNTTTRESNTTRQRCNLASLDCNTTCGACRTTSERCFIASQACNTTTQESNTAFVRCRITNGRIGLSKQPRGKRHQSRKRSSNSTMTDQTTRSSCRESYGIAAAHQRFRPSAIVFDAWVIVLGAGEECTSSCRRTRLVWSGRRCQGAKTPHVPTSFLCLRFLGSFSTSNSFRPFFRFSQLRRALFGFRKIIVQEKRNAKISQLFKNHWEKLGPPLRLF
jgi:hypothetical protein